MSGNRKFWLLLIAAFLLGGAVGGMALRTRYMMRAPPANGPGSAEYETAILHGAVRARQMQGAVALFGDSHTARLAASRLSRPAENFALSGNRIAWLEEHLPRYDLSGAAVLVIENGANDLGRREPGDYGAAYRRVLALVPARIPVVSVAIFPMRDPAPERLRNYRPLAASLNRQMAAACEKRPGCLLLDLTDRLAGADGRLLAQYAQAGDGVHLTPAGQGVYLEALDEMLARALQRR
jgi:lysophospholipase L1-like esterase